MRTRNFWFVLLLALGAAVAQQAPEATEESSPEDLASRVEALERLHRGPVGGPSDLSVTHLEGRLARIEGRLDRLEQRLLSGTAGPGPERYLESRIRALEREVSRLRR